MLNIILKNWLLAYQRQWLLDAAKYRAWLKARQIGATDVGVALDALLDALSFPHDVMVLSYRLEGSKDILRDIRKWIEVLGSLGQKIPHQASATMITLGNGSRIKAYPAQSEAVRGARGSVYWDEAAISRNSEDLWTALSPVISSNPRYRASLTSTPLGKRGAFYGACTSPQWSVHRTTIHDAVRAGLRRDVADLRANSLNFAREFECSWDAGGSYYTHDDLVTASEYHPVRSPDHDRFVLGVDLAQVHDFTALVLLRVHELTGHAHVVKTWQMRSLSYVDQREIILDVARSHNVTTLVLDSTKNPDTLDQLRKDLNVSSVQVIGQVFTNAWKAKAFPKLKKRFEEQTLSSDWDNNVKWDGSTFQPDKSRPLFNQLLEVQQGQTPSGLVSYTSPRSSQGHGDLACALVMASYYASQTSSPIQPIKSSNAKKRSIAF